MSELPNVTGEVYTRHQFPSETCPHVGWHELSDCSVEVYEEGSEPSPLGGGE